MAHDRAYDSAVGPNVHSLNIFKMTSLYPSNLYMFLRKLDRVLYVLTIVVVVITIIVQTNLHMNTVFMFIFKICYNTGNNE